MLKMQNQTAVTDLTAFSPVTPLPPTLPLDMKVRSKTCNVNVIRKVLWGRQYGTTAMRGDCQPETTVPGGNATFVGMTPLDVFKETSRHFSAVFRATETGKTKSVFL